MSKRPRTIGTTEETGEATDYAESFLEFARFMEEEMNENEREDEDD